MKSIQILKSTIIALVLVGCGDAEPVSTTYKKSYSSDATATPGAKPAGATPAIGSTPGTGNQAGQVGAPAGGGVVSNTPAGGTPAGGTPAGGTPAGGTPAGGAAGGAGDSAKGLSLLEPCKSCHTPGGLGANVALNKAIINRLDNANVVAPGFHGAYKATVFEGQGRKDVEAALNTL